MFFSRAPRHPVQFTAVYDDGERYLTAPVTNLSDSGLFIETSAPPKPGAEVHVIPLLPPSRGLPELEGVVVRVQDGKAELGRVTPTGVGIMFKTLGDDDAAQLRAFCDSLKAASGASSAAPTAAATSGSKPSSGTAAPDPLAGYQGLSLKRDGKPKSESKADAVKVDLAPAALDKTSTDQSAPAESTASDTAKPSAPQTELSSAEAQREAPVEATNQKKSGDSALEPVKTSKDLSTSSSSPTRSSPTPSSATPSSATPSSATPSSSTPSSATSAAKDTPLPAARAAGAGSKETTSRADVPPPEADLPMLNSEEAELVEGTRERPHLLSKTSQQPVLLERPKSAAAESETIDDDTTVQAERPSPSAEPVPPGEAQQAQSEAPGVGHPTPSGWESTGSATARVAFDEAITDPYGTEELGDLVPQRNHGLLIVIGVLNLFAIGGALAYGAYRLDEVNHWQSTADARLTDVGQDVAFLGNRAKTLGTTLEGHGKTLAALEAVVLSEPVLEQTLSVERAGTPGRFALQTRAIVVHEGEVEGEVVYATRRILVGDLAALTPAPGKAQALNGASQKGKVAWTVLEEEQLLSDGKKLSSFKSLSKKERSAMKKGAKIGDIVGALAAGGQREESRQLLLDLPQGGLVSVETEIGLLIDDKAVVLKDVATRGVAAALVAAPAK